jgi:hypothetical protein
MREMSLMSLISNASRVAWLTAVMLIGTDMMFSVRFCAVTTTSSSNEDVSEAAAELSAARAWSEARMNGAATEAHSKTREILGELIIYCLPSYAWAARLDKRADFGCRRSIPSVRQPTPPVSTVDTIVSSAPSTL